MNGVQPPPRQWETTAHVDSDDDSDDDDDDGTMKETVVCRLGGRQKLNPSLGISEDSNANPCCPACGVMLVSSPSYRLRMREKDEFRGLVKLSKKKRMGLEVQCSLHTSVLRAIRGQRFFQVTMHRDPEQLFSPSVTL